MIEKKTRTRIPKENKIRAELQKEISSVCPFCHSTEVGHFQIHHIDENPSNNQILNLILVCPTCHSKISKGDYSPMEVLQKKIQLLPQPGKPASNLTNPVTFNGKVTNSIVGNNNKVTLNVKKQVISQNKYVEGELGCDTQKANYISHLVTRYNEYKTNEVGKENMKYGIFQAALKKYFKIGATRTLNNLPVEKFTELVELIQKRINATTFAKKLGKGHKNFSTFQEYLEQQNK